MYRGKKKKSAFWAEEKEDDEDLGVLVCALEPQKRLGLQPNLDTVETVDIDAIDPLSVDSLGVLVCPLPQKPQKIDVDIDDKDK
jgi:hypothetical protein